MTIGSGIKNTLRVLPLCGAVPFPGSPPCYIGVGTSAAGLGTTLGLLPKLNGKVSQVGILVKAEREVPGLLRCSGIARFRLPDSSAPLPEALQDVQIFEDAQLTKEQEEQAHTLHNELWEAVCILSRLLGEEEDPFAPCKEPPAHLALFRPGTGSASDFSLALSATLDLDEAEKKRLLEGACLLERLHVLREALQEALSLCAAHASLRRLMSGAAPPPNDAHMASAADSAAADVLSAPVATAASVIARLQEYAASVGVDGASALEATDDARLEIIRKAIKQADEVLKKEEGLGVEQLGSLYALPNHNGPFVYCRRFRRVSSFSICSL